MNKDYIIKESKTFDEIIKKCPSKKNRSFIVFYRTKKESFSKYGIAAPEFPTSKMSIFAEYYEFSTVSTDLFSTCE